MKRLNILIVLLLTIASANAYVIKGRVIDEIDKSSIQGAVVGITTIVSDSTLNQVTTDPEGKFVFKNIHYNGNVAIKISYVGCNPITIELKGNTKSLDLGDILMSHKTESLDEVVVVASETIEKNDRILIFPTAEERKNSSDIINLLGNMRVKLPGIDVDELTRRISIDGKEPIFQINGKVEPLSKIRMINKNRILRIEYKNQADIRFSNDGINSGIINFILKNDFEGGSLHTRTGVTITTPRINGELGLTYNRKRSEWSLNYDNVWRNSSQQYTNIIEKYNGKNYTIERAQIGLPSNFKDFDNNISLGYSYKYNINTIFSTDLCLRYHNVKSKDNYIMQQNNDTDISDYTKINTRSSKTIDPTLNIYFNKIIGNRTIEFNLTGVYSFGDYYRSINYIYKPEEQYSQNNVTNNNSYLVSSEILYSNKFNYFTTQYGVNYSYNYVTNGYSESKNIIINTLAKHKLYVYGSIGGNIEKLGYSIGIGGRYESVSNDGISKQCIRPNISVSIKYPVLKKTVLSFNYNYMPSLPALFNYSEIMQTIDDISYQTGSLNIKPMEYHKAKLSSRTMIGKINVNLSMEYSRTINPLVNIWEYDSNPESKYYDKFISKTTNGKNDDRINIQMDISTQRFLKYFAIFGQFGWSKFNLLGGDKYNYVFDNFYASIGINAMVKNIDIISKYDILPRYSVNNLNISKNSGSFYIGCNWRYKNITAGIIAGNLFTSKANKVETTYISSVRPYNQEYYIKDFSNLVELTFQYNIDFGEKYRNVRRSLSREKIDRGVNNAY